MWRAALIVSLGIALLALLYKVVPDCFVPWSAAFGGALLAAIALLLGRYPLAVYLRHTWRNTIFGASGTIVGILIGFYAVAAILLLGGVASRLLADDPGRRADPHAGARRRRAQEVAQGSYFNQSTVVARIATGHATSAAPRSPLPRGSLRGE